MNSCNPIRAKTLRQKTVRIITSASFFTDWNRALTMVFRPVSHMISYYSLSLLRMPFTTESYLLPFSLKLFTFESLKTHFNQENSFLRNPRCLPGITEIALKALSTLNVRRTEKFPKLTNSVTYLQERRVPSHVTKSAIRKANTT